MSFFGELKRRNVFRAAAAYLAVAWLLVEVADTLFPLFGLGDDAVRIVVIVLAIGFVPAMITAWAFELTPEGFKPEAEVDHDSAVSRRMTRRLDRLFLIALALAVGFFALDKFVLDPARDAQELATAMEQAREEGRTEAEQGLRDASLAVLAFQDLSPEGDQEYLGDGVAVDLIDQLGSVPTLRVTGRTSAFSFKGAAATIPEIGEALNVAHVLDGSITRVGDRVRVSVQLLDARRDAQLWSQTYDAAMGDIFDIRDDITARVCDQLTLKFERLKQASLRTDPEVYELTLRARSLIFASDADGAKQASNMLERALAIDPDYVPALLQSIRANYYLQHFDLMADDEAERIGDERVERVLSIDPGNGTALMFLAWSDWEIRMDLESAARRFSHALRTAPGDLEAMRGAGMFARSVGRHAESIALLERCVAADPRNRLCAWQLFRAYLWAHRLDEAETAYRRNEALGGNGGEYYLILALLLRGEPTRAQSVLESVTDQDNPQMSAARAMILHDLGRYEESDAALQKTVGQIDTNFRDQAYLVAQANAWIGRTDTAFEWLEKAYLLDEQYGLHGHWFQRIMFLPVWQNLHGDPRWTELRERMGFSQSRLDGLEFTIPSWFNASLVTAGNRDVEEAVSAGLRTAE